MEGHSIAVVTNCRWKIRTNVSCILHAFGRYVVTVIIVHKKNWDYGHHSVKYISVFCNTFHGLSQFCNAKTQKIL